MEGINSVPIAEKVSNLICSTRVMTLAVSDNNTAWSSPVYFVFCSPKFYFFSSEKSRHVKWAEPCSKICVSIFHDSDSINEIFGVQMTGKLDCVSDHARYIRVTKAYTAKFSFLKKIFGRQLIDNPGFFLEKFNSRLYSFTPEEIFISDNSRNFGKRIKFDPAKL